MKKNVLSFCMLMLCIGLLPAATFAQGAPGTSGSGAVIDAAISLVNIDGSLNPSTLSAPPVGVGKVKRNNGNGTTLTGLGEARLAISNTNSDDYFLVIIASLDFSTTYEATFKNGTNEKNYISYPLDGNNLPAKKLMWIFKSKSNGKSFAATEQ